MPTYMINGICYDKPDGQGLPVRSALSVEQRPNSALFWVTCTRCGNSWDSTDPRALALSDGTIEAIRSRVARRKGHK